MAHAPEEPESKPLEIEGSTLREFVVVGNGRDAEVRAITADGRRFIFDFVGSHLKIRALGAILTEITRPDDGKLRVRYTADRLVLRIARTTLLEGVEDWDLGPRGFHLWPADSGVVVDGDFTLFGESHHDSVATTS